MDYNEVRKQAGDLKIKTYGLKQAEIEKLIAEKTEAITEKAPALTEEAKQEAKQARTGRRARRGGAVLGKGEMKFNRPEYQKKGYQRRFFKNEPGRVDAAYENDWDYVMKDGKKVTLRDGTNKDGSLRTMYLMEKHEDWYKADQVKKRAQDRKNDQLLRDGKVTAAGGEHGSDAAQAQAGVRTYEPSGGIQVNSLIKQ